MDRKNCTLLIMGTLEKKSIKLQDLADSIGKHIIWTTLALQGQATMNEDEAGKVSTFLGLGQEVALALQSMPIKGSLEVNPPADPLIYRFYEIVQVYGTTLKSVINEKFGDGIMSAIDFTMDMEKVETEGGTRVKITMDGKFLPYKKW
jgi:cyanate lyase